MAHVTYRQLLQHIQALPADMLDGNATITIYDEFYSVKTVGYADAANDVLDNGHMFLVANEDGEA